MRIRFTKMHGAGNDFVVLDETRGLLGLSREQYRFLADRHFGVGADQILSVRASPAPGFDFEYVIHNADGGEVEHCGNGARCFVRYVRDKGLTTKDSVRVRLAGGEIELKMQPDGRVAVDMGAPIFDLTRVPFDASGLQPIAEGSWQLFPLSFEHLSAAASVQSSKFATQNVAILSMGNPHAVLRVADVDAAPVAELGPLVEQHPRFARRVNAGFMQLVSRHRMALRVYERGAGETLACGTGACAAVVAGIRLGWLDHRVDVHTRGGRLTIEWAGHLQDSVVMTGPAQTVFEGEIDVPASLERGSPGAQAPSQAAGRLD